MHLLAGIASLGCLIATATDAHTERFSFFVPETLMKSFLQTMCLCHLVFMLNAFFVQNDVVLIVLAFLSFLLCFLSRFVFLVLGQQTFAEFLSTSGEWGFSLLILYDHNDLCSMAFYAKTTFVVSVIVAFGLYTVRSMRWVKLQEQL